MSSDNISLNSLKSQIESIRNEMITMVTETHILMNEISAKMDILINLDKQVPSTGTTEPVVKKSNKPVFFKQLFLTKRDEYMDILYTQEIIDSYKTHVDVLKKKNENDKIAKIGSLIYNECIKQNKPEGAKDQFEKIYANA
jgi:S-adenosylmethionine:tRNA-ribosyltransferase-isomerase (queuine synthetase)